MIVLNEKKEAERVINSGELGTKPSPALTLLARYYYWTQKSAGKDLFYKLDDFMRENYPGYKPEAWRKTLEGKVKKAGKYPLTEIDKVVVTKSEIERIRSLKSLRLERLAFTLLCIAKYGNLRNDNNNGWVCRPHNEIFRAASIPVTIREQAEMLSILYQKGFIDLSRKITNINIQVLFIDDMSHMAVNIYDFRELGAEYLNYIKKYKYTRCCECGRLIRCAGNGRTKYCGECSGTGRRAGKYL